jgi:Flp pilus assembly CpaF family ATPase
MLAMQSGTRLDPVALRAYIDRLVDIVVQLERTPRGRRIVEIRWHDAPAHQLRTDG